MKLFIMKYLSEKNSRCVCAEGFEGPMCERENVCPNDCSLHGVCKRRKCECAPGYGGESCSLVARCHYWSEAASGWVSEGLLTRLPAAGELASGASCDASCAPMACQSASWSEPRAVKLWGRQGTPASGRARG